MSNFLFFSFQEDLRIKYVKSTVKFDNYGEGRARFSFKIWLEKEYVGEIPEVFLLICNRENPTSLEVIDKSYVGYLIEERFRKAAGIENTEMEDEYDKFMVGEIMKFEEDPSLLGRRILNPKCISVEAVEPRALAEKIPRHLIRNEDILLKMQPIDKEIGKIIEGDLKINPIIEFQFRIFLGGFLPRQTLENWRSSSESWSVDIDIHKERGFEDVYEFFGNLLKYPENLDLWINIPHGHLFIASSPVYENTIKLKTEDIQYKTYKRYKKEEKEFYEKFETMEGDYSVKISNGEGKPKDFSIVSVSPFLPEEAPRKLREDMKEFEMKSKELKKSQENMLGELKKSQRNMLGNMVSIFGIFVAVFSFVIISANTVLRIQIPGGDFSFWETFLRVSALLLPIFLFLVSLLIIAIWSTRR